MSFSSETKGELCRERMSHLECAQAEAYGVLLFCNVFTPWEVRITTQSLDFAQRLPKLFQRAFGLAFDRTPEEETRGKQTFLCTDREKIARMLDTFGYSAETAVFQHINYAVLEEQMTKAAFLRGAFLSGTTWRSPPPITMSTESSRPCCLSWTCVPRRPPGNPTTSPISNRARSSRTSLPPSVRLWRPWR